MSSFGSQLSAIAPTIRWRIPPLISCGHCLIRRLGSWIFTATRSSLIRWIRQSPRRPVCLLRVSPIWSPMVNTGSRDIMGSCRIMAIFLPLISFISWLLFCRRSSPSKRTFPLTVSPEGGRTRRSEAATVLLPQPDSPITARRSPAWTSNDTSSTAFTIRVRAKEKKWVFNPMTCRSMFFSTIDHSILR